MPDAAPLVAALAALSVACADAPPPPAATPPAAVTDTLPGGIVRTRNPAPAPAFPWHFVEERTIQPDEGSPGALGEVRGVVATPDGGVAVIQTRPDAIKVFHPDGTFARTIGRSGEGPGEFRQAALGIHGDTLVVHDPGASRATTFLLDGTMVGSWRAPCCLIGMGRLPVDRTGRVWMIALRRGGGVFLRYRLDGTPVDTIATTPTQRGGSWSIRSTGGRGGMAVPIPLHPAMEWGFPPDGSFAYGRGDAYRIVIGRNGNDTSRIIEASDEGRPVTAAERDSLFRAALPDAPPVREAMRQTARQEDIPGTWPLWHALAFDDEGRLWVGRPGPGAVVASLDVFSPAGERLGNLPAPHPAILDGFWRGDRVVLYDEDANGRPLVRVYRLVGGVAPS